MKQQTQWREALSWWWDTPYVLIYDPQSVISSDPMTWSVPNPIVDEDVEVLELAQQLAILKKSNKH